MKAKCWKCQEENDERQDGYYWCQGCGLWYSPLKEQRIKQQFLDDEESEYM